MSSSSEYQAQLIMHPLPDKILNVHDVAAYLRLTKTTVRKLAASGELLGFKIGKSWRFDRDEIVGRITAAKLNMKEPAR